MSSFPISVLLLIAIAFSQIFGGVSCCCLSRSILEGWTIAGVSIESGTTGTGEEKQTRAQTPAKAAAPKCPRCAAADTPPRATNKQRPSAPVDGCLAGDSNQCDCVSQVLEADRTTESGSTTQTSHSWTTLHDLFPKRRETLSPLDRFEGPLFGSRGISWQAIACKWTT